MREEQLGQRQTRQRDVILTVIRDANGPLTVPEIHLRGQETVPGLGIATVYRTVRLLQDTRLVHPVVLPSGETRYEPTERGHHHHFQCRSCTGVFDLHLCPVEIPKSGLMAGGYQVDGHELTLYGLCPACAA